MGSERAPLTVQILGACHALSSVVVTCLGTSQKSNASRTMAWSTVSNALDRSSSTPASPGRCSQSAVARDADPPL
eukprot:731485-Alexandrium_andersonii.AAC.1